MPKTTRSTTNGGRENEDNPMDPPTAAAAAADQAMDDESEEDVNAKPRKMRKRRRSGKDDDRDAETQSRKPKAKRTRLHSPDPVESKSRKRSEDEDGNDERDSEMKDRNSEEDDDDSVDSDNNSDGKGAPEAAMIAQDAADSNGGTGSAKSTKQKKPKPNIRLPSHQTPGKFLNVTSVSSREDGAEEMPLPSRRLAFGASTVPKGASESLTQEPSATTTQESTPQDAIPQENGIRPESSSAGSQHEHAQVQQPSLQKLPAKVFAHPFGWFISFFFLQLVLQYGLHFEMSPIIINASSFCIGAYKSMWYTFKPPPTKRVLNQTFVDEIKGQALSRQAQKREMLQNLKDILRQLKPDIDEIESDASKISKELKAIDARVEEQMQPVLKLHDKLSQLDKLIQSKVQGGLNETMRALPEIIDLLGDADKGKLLDLSSLDLWEIPALPDSCGEFDDGGEGDDVDSLSSEGAGEAMEMVNVVVDESRVEEWVTKVKDLVKNVTDEIIDNSGTAKQMKKWIRDTIKARVEWDKALSKFSEDEVRNLMKFEKDKTGAKQVGSLLSESILDVIHDKIETDIADQTGVFDYASIRNGAVVILDGPQATSLSLVQHLPFLNRLMAHAGLRFYGHGPEAALSPSLPPNALGQCWAFLNEQEISKKRNTPRSARVFSRGNVATLAVRLAKPIHVQSVVIEHPPREVTDRSESSIRKFRVLGYEDTSASGNAFELGHFEYNPDKDRPLKVFQVVQQTSRQSVPKLKSVVLAIESTWGGSNDYGCLYRFRVQGSDND